MTPTTHRAFIAGYVSVANTLPGVCLSPDDPTFSEVIPKFQSAWDTSRLYYEAHITVEPHQSTTFDQFREGMSDDMWRVSAFSEDDVDSIQGKWFITCRHTSLEEITSHVRGMVRALDDIGLTVLRWKIEDTLLDSKHGDQL